MSGVLCGSEEEEKWNTQIHDQGEMLRMDGTREGA